MALWVEFEGISQQKVSQQVDLEIRPYRMETNLKYQYFGVGICSLLSTNTVQESFKF
jgi:hypothetical protein